MSEPDHRPALQTPVWLWGPVLFQMALIFIASSIPDLTTLPGGISDKSGHGLGYGILGAVLLRALAGGRLQGITWRRAAAALLLASAYGVSDEFHQSFVPGRSPDRFDVLADTIGAAVTIALGGGARAWAILRSSSRSHPQP